MVKSASLPCSFKDLSQCQLTQLVHPQHQLNPASGRMTVSQKKSDHHDYQCDSRVLNSRVSLDLQVWSRFMYVSSLDAWTIPFTHSVFSFHAIYFCRTWNCLVLSYVCHLPIWIDFFGQQHRTFSQIIHMKSILYPIIPSYLFHLLSLKFHLFIELITPT